MSSYLNFFKHILSVILDLGDKTSFSIYSESSYLNHYNYPLVLHSKTTLPENI